MSAHPLIESKSLQAKKIKMAMALTGKNRHYHWYNIQPRHFFSTAKQVGFNSKTAQSILSNMISSLDEVIQRVEGQIPENFPERIVERLLTVCLSSESIIQQR